MLYITLLDMKEESEEQGTPRDAKIIVGAIIGIALLYLGYAAYSATEQPTSWEQTAQVAAEKAPEYIVWPTPPDNLDGKDYTLDQLAAFAISKLVVSDQERFNKIPNRYHLAYTDDLNSIGGQEANSGEFDAVGGIIKINSRTKQLDNNYQRAGIVLHELSHASEWQTPPYGYDACIQTEVTAFATQKAYLGALTTSQRKLALLANMGRLDDGYTYQYLYTHTPGQVIVSLGYPAYCKSVN